MACNENVIKNMANEITRNCQGQNVTVDPEFVIYLIDLLLLNPKYGKLFTKTINRNNLAYFVDECGSMVMRGGTALNIMKMQFILQTNYDKLHILVEKHLDTIAKCLSPLVNEITEMDPDTNDQAGFEKLFRKISIYFILASGLGNPGFIVTLKEGMAALESVFSMEDLKLFVAVPHKEKLQQLKVLLGYTAGVRLFNRDCKKGGEGIPDLPHNLIDAAKACSVLLSNSLITVMQKVNTLTTAIEDVITMQDETGNVMVDMTKNLGVTIEDYKEVFDLLAFNRQYEVFIRKLLADVESMTQKADQYVQRTHAVLQELHAAVKYKTAVPVVNVFTLKEGMAALESVFSMEDLKLFVAVPHKEKLQQLKVLLGYTAGVRLFNRDCKKGGEGIPDLPHNLIDAAKACSVLLSNSLITVMQKVNTLTTAIEDVITMQDETGNVMVDMTKNLGVTIEDYKEVFDLLAFNRQYEVFIRKLLADVESMTQKADQYVQRTHAVLQELHAAVKYKTAVPVVNVFPLFTKLWEVWRAMQNCMFLVSTVNRLMAIMASIQEQITMPHEIIDKLLGGRTVTSDQTRVSHRPSMEERLFLASLPNYICYPSSTDLLAIKQAEFLGFCALCLSVGALVPSNIKIGLIKIKGRYYGFCCVKMAGRFSKEPERYVNEVLNHARNSPHLINLLNIVDHVFNVKDIDDLIVVRVPKIKVFDKDIQTEAHPLDEYKQKNYSWDLWEWKRRACQWARIVNCQTHSTQTDYSHLRSEIQCQTVEPRHKCLQTNKDKGINTVNSTYFLWGLRGQRGYGQHPMDLKPQHSMMALKAQPVTTCTWPCVETESLDEEVVEEQKEFYLPEEPE